jgi:two-component system sensor histidine kinase HydH
MPMDAQLAQVVQIAWTAEGRVSDAEGPCEQVLGRSRTELVGKPLHEALGISPLRAEELHAKAQASTTPSAEFVSFPRTKEETGKTLRLTLQQQDSGFHASVLDLTAMLQGAPPLQIGRLSSSLSHEIRNPLSSVKMAVQTLARNPGLSDRDKRRLTIANREIRTIERMLWMLSEYGRDSAPTLDLVSLASVVQEAGQLVELELAERKISLDILPASQEPPRARLDAGRLRPVLAQVLLNAVQGLPEGASLPVHLSRDGAFAVLEIDDASSALPHADQQKAFEPFGSHLARGAGLSLAALKGVMTSIGGTVEARGGESPPTHLKLCFPT